MWILPFPEGSLSSHSVWVSDWLCLVTKLMAIHADAMSSLEFIQGASHPQQNYKLERSNARQFDSTAIAEYFRCRRDQSVSSYIRISDQWYGTSEVFKSRTPHNSSPRFMRVRSLERCLLQKLNYSVKHVNSIRQNTVNPTHQDK